MTDNTPPTKASSATSTQNPYSGHSDSQRTMFLPTYSTGTPYGNYSSWNNLWPSSYSGYASMAVNPALQAKMPPYGTGYAPQRPFQPSAYPPLASKTSHNVDLGTSSNSLAPRVNTPPLPHPDVYRHWDNIFKAFLEKTKLTQCRRGFELDMLVLSSDWEQRVLPEALKDLVHGMQVILDRISGKAGDDTEIQADTNENISLSKQRSLDDRKLDYIPLNNGKKLELQSSVTKSISQFLARSRDRNDRSNHAEFLQSLAEKRETSTTGTSDQTSNSTTIDEEMQEVFSCARVDAKTIDRAKQIKYDIMKNEDGPLKRTASIKPPPSDPAVTTQNPSESAAAVSSSTSLANQRSSPLDDAGLPIRKKRRLANVDDSSKNTSKTESKATEGQPPVLSLPQDDTGSISSSLVPAIDDRIRNIEEHLSIRYVPSPPHALLSRLKYLEDHLIRLEKEYPPWAALHFKQPNRGWPPPPRSTPTIVPPHLRSTIGKQSNSSADPALPPFLLPQANGQPSGGTIKAKPRHKNSTLHNAVMDRLEIQQAMNEMGFQ